MIMKVRSNIRKINSDRDLTRDQIREVRKFLRTALESVLTPIGIDIITRGLVYTRRNSFRHRYIDWNCWEE